MQGERRARCAEGSGCARAGRWLFSCYYSAGYCAVHSLGPDGHLLPTDQQPACLVKLNQGAHCIKSDASNRHVFVPEVAAINHPYGSRINQFAFDPETGQLTSCAPPLIPPPEPADPSLGPLWSEFGGDLRWPGGRPEWQLGDPYAGPRNRFNSRAEAGP